MALLIVHRRDLLSAVLGEPDTTVGIVGDQLAVKCEGYSLFDDQGHRVRCARTVVAHRVSVVRADLCIDLIDTCLDMWRSNFEQAQRAHLRDDIGFDLAFVEFNRARARLR